MARIKAKLYQHMNQNHMNQKASLTALRGEAYTSVNQTRSTKIKTARWMAENWKIWNGK